jgi:putative signal transducing protein
MERPPIPHPAGPGDPDRLVEIASFPHPLEAHLAAARLRCEGVLVSLSGEHAAGLLSGVDCVRLWVREVDRARAVESLAPLSPKTGAPRRSAHFVTGDLDAPRCPRCGGLALEAERIHGPFFLFLWVFLRGARHVWRPQLRCRLCNARWKPALGDQGRSNTFLPPGLPGA